MISAKKQVVSCLATGELAFLQYTRKLIKMPGAISKDDIEAMYAAGADDGEILEVCQCCALFNYPNRSLSGLDFIKPHASQSSS